MSNSLLHIKRLLVSLQSAKILYDHFYAGLYRDIRNAGNMGCCEHIVLKDGIVRVDRFFPEDVEACPGNLTG